MNFVDKMMVTYRVPWDLFHKRDSAGEIFVRGNLANEEVGDLLCGQCAGFPWDNVSSWTLIEAAVLHVSDLMII